jgi:hypothetical protein
MTPTFFGRVQSRLFLLLFIGVPWTLLVSAVLPGVPAGVSTSEVYKVTFRALAIVAIVGVVIWEPIYHGLQQFRWEKDWPSLFALVVGVPEGALAYALLADSMNSARPPFWTFFWHFAPLWILVWAVAIGPVRVVLLRYRFRGGRFI